MKPLVSIALLRQKITDIRKEITTHKTAMKKYLEAGDASTALWLFEMIIICETGLKRHASDIRREQPQMKGGQHG